MQEGAGADIEEIEYWLMWTMDKPKEVWATVSGHQTASLK